MKQKLTHSKWFLYLTEFFAGMSVMAAEVWYNGREISAGEGTGHV